MFALDTNTVSYFFKGIGRVGERLLATSPGDIGIPAVVLYEIEFGIRRAEHASRRRSQLRSLLRVIQVLPFGEAEALSAAEIRAALERQGTPIGFHDTLIAATAKERGAVLVTHNVAEFSRVKGLRVEDWF